MELKTSRSLSFFYYEKNKHHWRAWVRQLKWLRLYEICIHMGCTFIRIADVDLHERLYSITTLRATVTSSALSVSSPLSQISFGVECNVTSWSYTESHWSEHACIHAPTLYLRFDIKNFMGNEKSFVEVQTKWISTFLKSTKKIRLFQKN